MIPATAIIVTRGDRPASVRMIEAELSEAFDNVVVWDNSSSPIDLKVFGRYVAAGSSDYDLPVYFQDDDCVVDFRKLWELYQARPREALTLCNMPEEHRSKYPDGIALVGFGCFTRRSVIRMAFDAYRAVYAVDDIFLRECDRIFTALNAGRIQLADVQVDHLPHATGSDRLYREPMHAAHLATIRGRIAYIKELGCTTTQNH